MYMKVSRLLDGLNIVGFDLDVDFEADIKDISFDSRDIKKKAPFFAYRGAKFDSHDFAKEAYEKQKAPFVVAEHAIDGVPTVIVEDGRKAIALAARNLFGRPDEEMTKIGVTGTNGKTTTTYIIESILNEAGYKPVRIGTTGVHFMGKTVDLDSTTPSTYDYYKTLKLAKDAGCDCMVMEVSSHALDQDRVYGTVFDIGIFSNLTGDHLDYHKTMEEYYAAKAKLFTPEYCKIGVINADHDYGKRMAKESQVDKVTFGISPKTDISAEEIWFGLEGIKATLTCPAGKILINSKLVGLHNLENLLAAASAGIMLGIDNETIKRGIESMVNVPGRLEKFKKPNGAFIFVDYAHTDDALINVLSALGNFRENRLITVFGCGGDRDRTKRPRMAKAAEMYSDVVVVTSDNPRTEDPQQIYDDILRGFEKPENAMLTPDRRHAIQQAVGMAEEKDIVLIAGKGHEDYMIIGREKIHFDDREEVKKCLEG